jgi:hypothetical protein
MASDVQVFDGVQWVSIKGPPGPVVVSSDSGNCSRIGTDGRIHTPALPLVGGTVTGAVVMEGSAANLTIQSTAGQFNVINKNAATGVVNAQYRFQAQATGNFRIFDITAAADRLRILPTGAVEIPGTLKVGPNTLPATAGTTGQFLATDGAGVLSWQTVATGPTGSFLPLTGGTLTGNVAVTTAAGSTVSVTGTTGSVALASTTSGTSWQVTADITGELDFMRAGVTRFSISSPSVVPHQLSAAMISWLNPS